MRSEMREEGQYISFVDSSNNTRRRKCASLTPLRKSELEQMHLMSSEGHPPMLPPDVNEVTQVCYFSESVSSRA
jgi:hypothetical protein